MKFFFVMHPDREPARGGELPFVRIEGRLIPLTRAALDRLGIDREGETTTVAPPPRSSITQ